MAGRPRGEVLERNWKKGRGYALCFSAYGRREYLTLGFEDDGWARKVAAYRAEPDNLVSRAAPVGGATKTACACACSP